MACNISIPQDGVTGIVNASGQLTSITVQGTAEDCKDCTNIIVKINSSSAQAVFTDDTHWTATISNPDNARCGEGLKIFAVCESKPEFKAEWFGILPCEPATPTPSPCPTEVDIVIVVTPDCNEDGRLVNFEVSFVGTQPIAWQWEFGDGSNSELIFPSAGTTISHRYETDSSSYQGELVVANENCSTTPFTVAGIDPCPAIECPEIEVKLKITNLDSGLDLTSNVDKEECLKEGKYQVEVLEPSGSDLDFTWFVNDNSQQGQTEAKITVELQCDEEVQVIVNVADGSCLYASSVDLVGCECQPRECEEKEVKLKVTDEAGAEVTEDVQSNECLNPGIYKIEVVEPTGSNTSFAWFKDGNPIPGQNQETLEVELVCEQEIDLVVNIEDDECPYVGSLKLQGCDCDDTIVIPPPPPPDSEWKINLCKIWFWVNVFLFIATGIIIFITLCLIEATVWSAIGALGSGGTLGAVFGALSAVNITMLIISLVLIVVTLLSFILWIIICAFGLSREHICPALTLLNDILSVLIALSFAVAIVFLLASKLGCAAGGFVDVAWFSILLSINWIVGRFLGCFR